MTIPKACVVGWPIKHSRSPVIHRFWLKELGIAGDYVVQPVEPERAAIFFARFAESGYVGANVTVPHKETAYAAVGRREPAARAIGAVNTLWLEDGVLVGTNTDATGFLANLDQEAAGWDRGAQSAVVLGAGGAARAIVWALTTRGIGQIHVVNRTAARALALAERFGPTVRVAETAALPDLLAGADLLVNTTSLGMEGQPPLAIDLAPMRPTALVNDLVYVPLETPLLKAARARGLATVDGLGMLLHQAAPGFERWFGARPKVTPALRQAVLADLGQRR
jgi:shikimate dehydrogenase